jgi:TetR/AcrR family transcriptional repressor of nem operon
MGRSNRQQADKNRQHIVEAADAMMRAGGVHAVSIADLMARVGMTQGGFYKHFESKDALIAEACSSGFARSVESWKAKGIPAAQPASGAFKRLVLHYFESKPVEQGCPMVALGKDAAPHHAGAALHDAYREGVERLFSVFKEVAKADPSCSLSDDELIAAFAAIVGANMLAQGTGDAKWLTAVAEAPWLSSTMRG